MSSSLFSERDNTRGLLAHAQKKAQETHQRVSDAIDRMLDQKQKINFSTVTRADGVTKAYLYNHPAGLNRRFRKLG